MPVGDYQILLHADTNRGQPYDQWPPELKSMRKAVERLRKRGYLRRIYWPTRYVITRHGYSLVQWLRAIIREHDSDTAAKV